MSLTYTKVFEEDVEYSEEQFSLAHAPMKGIASGFEYEVDWVNKEITLVGGEFWYEGYSYIVNGNNTGRYSTTNRYIYCYLYLSTTGGVDYARIGVGYSDWHDENNAEDYEDMVCPLYILDTLKQEVIDVHSYEQKISLGEVDAKINSNGELTQLFNETVNFDTDFTLSDNPNLYSTLYFVFSNDDYKVRHEVKTHRFSDDYREYYAGVSTPISGTISTIETFLHEFSCRTSGNANTSPQTLVLDRSRIVGKNNSNTIVYQSTLSLTEIWGQKY